MARGHVWRRTHTKSEGLKLRAKTYIQISQMKTRATCLDRELSGEREQHA